MRTLVFLLAAAACDSSTSSVSLGPPRTDPDAVHVEGSTFRDGRGRQLLFRGYNAKASPVFDVTFDDGRTANETFLSFDEAGGQRFEELGFDVLRLPVNWSGLEPHPLEYSEAFLSKIDEILAIAKAHHFYVFIDMHQDAYSKEIGEDGQPLWAIVPPPPALLSGPSDDSRRTSQPVLTAGFDFFDDENATDGRPLQEAFIAAVQQIARRVQGNPQVLGFEAFNEPVVLRTDLLDAFHASFADAIHAIDRDAPVLFEPVAFRNENDQAVIPSSPWSHGPGVYAPHIYTGWFSIPSQNGWETQDPSLLEPSMTHAVAEATGWGTPMFVTEFGCDQTLDRCATWFSAELDLQDRHLTSSTAWEFSGLGNWGFRGSDGQEHAATRKVLARTYPRAVAGDIVAIERPAPGDMLVRYTQTARTAGLEHEVSMSDDYATGWSVQCNGSPVAFTRTSGRATFVCPAVTGEATFEVIGTPVP